MHDDVSYVSASFLCTENETEPIDVVRSDIPYLLPVGLASGVAVIMMVTVLILVSMRFLAKKSPHVYDDVVPSKHLLEHHNYWNLTSIKS